MSKIFEFKFDVGDRVWEIRNFRKKTWIVCTFCAGIGKVVGANSLTLNCPECYGRKGQYEYLPTEWAISERSPATIGQQRVEITGLCDGGSDTFENYEKRGRSVEEQYMCVESGVGSGSLYHAEDLFADRDEAQHECDKRNAAEKLAAQTAEAAND